MFSGCTSLTSLNVSSLNTENVTDMSYMFYNCSSLTSLNLSNFDMNNVTNKFFMCSNLATTSGACTITCPAAVQTELESGTDLPTWVITFTWLRPTSK
jgi:surface protein